MIGNRCYCATAKAFQADFGNTCSWEISKEAVDFWVLYQHMFDARYLPQVRVFSFARKSHLFWNLQNSCRWLCVVKARNLITTLLAFELDMTAVSIPSSKDVMQKSFAMPNYFKDRSVVFERHRAHWEGSGRKQKSVVFYPATTATQWLRIFLLQDFALLIASLEFFWWNDCI